MKLIQKNLLAKFSAIRDDVVELNDANDRRITILSEAIQTCSTLTGEVALNIKQLLEYLLSSFQYDIDAIIDYLKNDLENEFDRETIRREEADDFDGRYNTRTKSMIEQIELPETIDIHRLQFASRYHPTPVITIEEALKKVSDLGVDYETWTFIDIGAGLGRNLLIASRYPFRKVLGIEISTYLSKIAQENIRRYSMVEPLRSEITVSCIDVLNYEFATEPTILYFWEPFGQDVQEKFVTNIENFVKQSSVDIILIFYGRVFPRIIDSPFFEQVPGISSSTDEMLQLSYYRLKAGSDIVP